MSLNSKLLEKVDFRTLTSKQKENYNFHLLSALLAKYGATSIRLHDDWEGADFIGQFNDGSFYKIQLKSRLTFEKKYENKDLYIAFPYEGKDTWYIYPHDEVLCRLFEKSIIKNTESWNTKGKYSFGKISKQIKLILDDYKIEVIII